MEASFELVFDWSCRRRHRWPDEDLLFGRTVVTDSQTLSTTHHNRTNNRSDDRLLRRVHYVRHTITRWPDYDCPLRPTRRTTRVTDSTDKDRTLAPKATVMVFGIESSSPVIDDPTLTCSLARDSSHRFTDFVDDSPKPHQYFRLYHRLVTRRVLTDNSRLNRSVTLR